MPRIPIDANTITAPAAASAAQTAQQISFFAGFDYVWGTVYLFFLIAFILGLAWAFRMYKQILSMRRVHHITGTAWRTYWIWDARTEFKLPDSKGTILLTEDCFVPDPKGRGYHAVLVGNNSYLSKPETIQAAVRKAGKAGTGNEQGEFVMFEPADARELEAIRESGLAAEAARASRGFRFDKNAMVKLAVIIGLVMAVIVVIQVTGFYDFKALLQ